MRRATTRLAVVLAVVLTQLLTSAALAAGADRKTVAVEFSLPDDSGFEIEFSAEGQGRRSFGAFDTRLDTRTRSSGAAYFSGRAGRISGRRVEIRLRPVGMVSVRFEERSTRKFEVPGCDGRTIVRRGVFRGRFEFEGEDGYAASAGRRAEGKVTVQRLRNCGGTPARIRPPREVVLASCQADTDTIYFASGGDGPPASHSAFVFDQLADLIVIRDASVFSNQDEIETAADLSTATVTPPPPFAGTGKYDSRRLEGDLAVSLPGMTEPLTLTPAKAKLKRGRGLGIGISCGSVVGIGRPGSPHLSGRLAEAAGLPPLAARHVLAAGAGR